MIKVEFILTNENIEDYADEYILEWLKYELGNRGFMCKENPLSDSDIKSNSIKIKREI